MIKSLKEIKLAYPSVTFNILGYLNQNDAFIHPILIEEELRKEKIRYDGNLNELLKNMADDKLLEPKLAKSTGEFLYRLNERGKKLFLMQEEKASPQ